MCVGSVVAVKLEPPFEVMLLIVRVSMSANTTVASWPLPVGSFMNDHPVSKVTVMRRTS